MIFYGFFHGKSPFLGDYIDSLFPSIEESETLPLESSPQRNLGETDDQHQQHDEGWELVCDDWHHHTGTTAGSKCDKLKDFCEERLHLHGQEAEHLKSECYAGNSKFSVAPLWSQQTDCEALSSISARLLLGRQCLKTWPVAASGQFYFCCCSCREQVAPTAWCFPTIGIPAAG